MQVTEGIPTGEEVSESTEDSVKATLDVSNAPGQQAMKNSWICCS